MMIRSCLVLLPLIALCFLKESFSAALQDQDELSSILSPVVYKVLVEKYPQLFDPSYLEKRYKTYEFGLGKRRNSYSFGLGKRAQRFSFGLGKRPKLYSFGIGKRDALFDEEEKMEMAGEGNNEGSSLSIPTRTKRDIPEMDFADGDTLAYGPSSEFLDNVDSDEEGIATAAFLSEKRKDESTAPQRFFQFGLEKRPSSTFNFGLGKRDSFGDYNDVGFENEEEAEFEELKRAKDPYSFGLGKRARAPYSFGLGKRAGGIYEFGLGKRGSGLYKFGLGKRNAQLYKFGLGKRGPELYQFGLGKKSPSLYEFGLGKRDPVLYEFGLGKRAPHLYEFGLGKRAPRLYGFGLGKRAPSLYELGQEIPKFGLGNSDYSERPEKIRNSFKNDSENQTSPKELYDSVVDKREIMEDETKGSKDIERRTNLYKFGLGKRAAYNFGLGKRSENFT